MKLFKENLIAALFGLFFSVLIVYSINNFQYLYGDINSSGYAQNIINSIDIKKRDKFLEFVINKNID